MAEIRVRPKRRSLAWLWVLLTLVVLALVAWYLVNAGIVRVHSTSSAPGAATSAVAIPSLFWS